MSILTVNNTFPNLNLLGKIFDPPKSAFFSFDDFVTPYPIKSYIFLKIPNLAKVDFSDRTQIQR
jgi:hypothetical protein